MDAVDSTNHNLDEGYYYTGQTPFRKPNESKLHFHARRLISIQTLGRLEYTVEEAETKFNRALGPVELTFVGLENFAREKKSDKVGSQAFNEDTLWLF
ncbi:hypothetical protein BG004_006917 [Podila humilis]|nr:hypothetical protein BG004_006917 [Podila humilis]